MSTQISKQETQYRLSELIHYYEVCNRAEGKSLKTISWYSANLRRFRRFVMSRHPPDSLENIDIQGVIPLDLTTTPPSDNDPSLLHHWTNIGITVAL